MKNILLLREIPQLYCRYKRGTLEKIIRYTYSQKFRWTMEKIIMKKDNSKDMKVCDERQMKDNTHNTHILHIF